MNPKAAIIRLLGLGVMVLASALVVNVLTGGGVRVDGSRADCEAKFPGLRCMIVWVPEMKP
ncbi:MAG: hypothetical protein JWR51_4681 [Devosia sp.]|nr:hypothetical protein [Devosia sp.]